ncbi:hypothetical protein P8452_66321 [Trifolium repens]|nr:hypothetical protein P8452_66321 [Trifolium repens]
MARKRKAQTEIVPDEVPPAPTQEAQNTLNETPLENQDAEAAIEPTNRIIGFIYVRAPHTAEVICDFL